MNPIDLKPTVSGSATMLSEHPRSAHLRVQVASDLHLEFIKRRFPGERVIKPLLDADLLVLAGDIDIGFGALDAFGDWPVPILYVIGNHESYGRVYDEDREALRAACDGTNIVLLDKDVVTVADLAVRFPAWAASRASALPDVRFIGCTLWTGYRYSACGKSHEGQMELAERALNDHRLIRLSTGPFDALAALACHEADCAWLRGELAKPFTGDTVVITHHAPSERSVHPRFQGDPLTGAFVTDLPDLLEQAQVWIHGHHHDSSDYVERGCRVVCNPCGYPRGLGSIRHVEEMHFENTKFDGNLLIRLPSAELAAGSQALHASASSLT
jgi:predicted phosphodiesterase